jgi:hypothetical protein
MKVVSPMHQPPFLFSPGLTMKNSNYIGNRTRDLPACSAAPQPTAPPAALFLSDFKKLEFSRKIFEKYSNVTFHKNPPGGSRVLPCGRTDGHDEAYGRFSQFCKRA